MMSRNLERKKIEELLFSFKFEIATVQDFKFYLNLRENINISYNSYLSKLHNYFQRNYLGKLRKYSEQTLKDHPDLLKKLNSMFLAKYDPHELLQHIKEDYCSEKADDELNFLKIKYNIERIFEENEFDNLTLPNELLFYLYILSLVQSNKKNIQNKVSQLLNTFKTPNNIHRLIQLPSHLQLNEIKKEIVLNKLLSGKLVDENDDVKYVVLIKLFDCISFPIDLKTIKQEIEMVIDNFKTFYNNNKIQQVFLDYFKHVNFNDKSKYIDIFQWIYSKGKNNQLNNFILLCEWISSQIIFHEIDISALNVPFCETFFSQIETYLSNSTNDFKTKVFPKMLVYICDQEKNQVNLNFCYKSFLNSLKMIIYGACCTNEIKLSIFYFKLIYKILKTQTMINQLILVGLNPSNAQEFKIPFCFMYLNSNLRKKMIGKNVIKFSNNGNEYFNFDNKYNSFDYKDFNTLLNCEAIKRTSLQKRPMSSSTKLLSLKYYIIFLEVNQSDFRLISNEWCFNNRYISFKCLQDNTSIEYVLKGLLISNKKQERHILLYEQLSQCWYSFDYSKWSSDLKLPDEIEKLTLIYFRRKKSLFNNVINIYQDHFQELSNIEENDFYWTIINNIIEINPNIIQQNIDMFYKLYSLRKIQNIRTIYIHLKKKNLLQNKKVNNLLIEIINKRSKDTYKNKKNSLILEIEKNYYFMNSTTFLKGIISFLNINNHNINYDYEYNQILWNISYYFDNYGLIKNIPKQLMFYITFIYVLSQLTTKDPKEFYHNHLNKIKIIPNYYPVRSVFLTDAFKGESQKNKFHKIETYWKETQMIMIDDYIWKFLSELLIFSCKEIFRPKDFKLTININEISKKLNSFLDSNKTLLSVKNIKNENIEKCFDFFYNVLKTYDSNSKELYAHFVKECFELTLRDEKYDSIQLTDFQKIIYWDYLNKYIRNNNFLSERNLDVIVKKLTCVARFLHNYEEQAIFSECFIKLKNKGDLFYKKIQPLLFVLFKRYQTKEFSDLRFSIIHYLTYCKIEKHKKQFEQISLSLNDIDNTQPEINLNTNIIFSLLNKQIQNIIEKSKDVNILTYAYKDFKEKKELKFPLKTHLDNNIQQNTNSIQKTNANEDIPILKENIVKEDNTKIISNQLFPNDLLNKKQCPYILYLIHEKNNKIKEQIQYSKGTYQLRGAIIKYIDHTSILLKNKSNSYWYSVCNKEWTNSLHYYIKNKNLVKIIIVYYLIERKLQSEKINFNCLEQTEKSILFQNYMDTELKWMLENIISILINNSLLFYDMFNFAEPSQFEKFLKIKVQWDNDRIKEFKNKIEHINEENKRLIIQASHFCN